MAQTPPPTPPTPRPISIFPQYFSSSPLGIKAPLLEKRKEALQGRMKLALPL